MRKKHDHSALLKYMHMLEEGHSIKYIGRNYGIDRSRLSKLWLLYQKEGAKVLHRQPNVRANGEFRHKVVLDIENNGIFHYYNNDRIKLRLKGKSPVQYRTLYQ